MGCAYSADDQHSSAACDTSDGAGRGMVPEQRQWGGGVHVEGSDPPPCPSHGTGVPILSAGSEGSGRSPKIFCSTRPGPFQTMPLPLSGSRHRPRPYNRSTIIRLVKTYLSEDRHATVLRGTNRQEPSERLGCCGRPNGHFAPLFSGRCQTLSHGIRPSAKRFC